ncbi:MAG: hypothetical protein WBN96_09970 [Gammaproteobacteria bacterium]
MLDCAAQSVYDQPVSAADHARAIQLLLDWIATAAAALKIVAAGHRVVHGGTRFHAPAVLDAEVIAYLHSLVPLAPSHPACKASPNCCGCSPI